MTINKLKIFLDDFWCYESLSDSAAGPFIWEGDFNEILYKYRDPKSFYLLVSDKCMNGWQIKLELIKNENEQEQQGWYKSKDLKSECRPVTILEEFYCKYYPPDNLWMRINSFSPF